MGGFGHCWDSADFNFWVKGYSEDGGVTLNIVSWGLMIDGTSLYGLFSKKCFAFLLYFTRPPLSQNESTIDTIYNQSEAQ